MLPNEVNATKDERNWIVMMYLSTLTGASLLPGLGWAIPWVLWFYKKDQSAFIDHAGKDLANFLLNALIFTALGSILMVVGVGVILIACSYIAVICFPIYAAIQVSSGKQYQFPYFFRLLK